MAKAKETKSENASVEQEKNPGNPGSFSSPKPRNAEEAAFQKASADNYDPHRLENPHSSVMTVAQAEAIVKKYGDFKGNEVPNDLARARKILNIK